MGELVLDADSCTELLAALAGREPFAESLLESLVSEGKIRYYGWSTDSVEGARLFAQGKHCVAIQHDLNVILDAPEMLAVCEESNLASVNRSALARGALSGWRRPTG